MKIVEGQEYQLESTYGSVNFYLAVLLKRTYGGLPLYSLGHGPAAYFSEDGVALRFSSKRMQYEADPDPLHMLCEVDQDRKRRRQHGVVTILTIDQHFHEVRSGKNNDPFSCGTASDEILAQAELVRVEMEKLLAMLEAAPK